MPMVRYTTAERERVARAAAKHGVAAAARKLGMKEHVVRALHDRARGARRGKQSLAVPAEVKAFLRRVSIEVKSFKRVGAVFLDGRFVGVAVATADGAITDWTDALMQAARARVGAEA